MPNRKKRWKRERAADGVECGCCLFDVFGVIGLLSVAAVRRRRGRRRP